MAVASGWESEDQGTNPSTSDNLWPQVATKFTQNFVRKSDCQIFFDKKISLSSCEMEFFFLIKYKMLTQCPLTPSILMKNK